MSLYETKTCQEMEEWLFGALGRQGKLIVSTVVNPPEGNGENTPRKYVGTIYLESSLPQVLNFASNLLILASHLGGVGHASRRPLHWLNVKNKTEILRGCHWEVTLPADIYLTCNKSDWQKLFKAIRNTLSVVTKLCRQEYEKDEHKEGYQKLNWKTKKRTCNPGFPESRQQDVLDANAQIILVKCPNLKPPKKVEDWRTEGITDTVRGEGLKLLYSDSKFKGGEEGEEGENVGGRLGTPSYVWIKSVFPYQENSYQENPYQVVTIFGTNNSQRQDFAIELNTLQDTLVIQNVLDT